MKTEFDYYEGEEDIDPLFKTLYELKIRTEYEIDEFMRDFGIPNPERYTDENEWRYLKRGSALICMGVTINESSVSLNAYSKIMEIPSDNDLILPLMRELLEINAFLPNESRFAIINNNVVVTVSKIIMDHSEALISFCLELLSHIADDYDDYLIEKYGGTSKTRKCI